MRDNELLYLTGVMVSLYGLARGNTPLALAALAFTATLALGDLYARYALYGVTIEREVLGPQAIPHGGTVTYRWTVHNRKWLPLIACAVAEELPASLGVEAVRTRPSRRPGRAVIPAVLSLRWFEEVSREYRLTATRRGLHRLGPAEAMAPSLYGEARAERELGAALELVVLPRVVPVRGLPVDATAPYGDRPRRDWVRTDPLTVVGVRPYRPGDPWRQIHWNAWAKTGRPQSKVLFAVARPAGLIVLDLTTFELPWQGTNPQVLEKLIVMAASLAEELTAQKLAVGLLANAPIPRRSPQVYIPASPGPKHLATLLAALGSLAGPHSIQADRLLERTDTAYYQTVVLVAARATGAVCNAAALAASRGHQVTALLLEEPAAGSPLRAAAACAVLVSGGEWDTLDVLEFSDPA